MRKNFYMSRIQTTAAHMVQLLLAGHLRDARNRKSKIKLKRKSKEMQTIILPLNHRSHVPRCLTKMQMIVKSQLGKNPGANKSVLERMTDCQSQLGFCIIQNGQQIRTIVCISTYVSCNTKHTLVGFFLPLSLHAIRSKCIIITPPNRTKAPNIANKSFLFHGPVRPYCLG